MNPIGPRACYDEGKRVAETLTYGFHRQDGVDVRVARIFNTYGTYAKLTYISRRSPISDFRPPQYVQLMRNRTPHRLTFAQ